MLLFTTTAHQEISTVSTGVVIDKRQLWYASSDRGQPYQTIERTRLKGAGNEVHARRPVLTSVLTRNESESRRFRSESSCSFTHHQSMIPSPRLNRLTSGWTVTDQTNCTFNLISATQGVKRYLVQVQCKTLHQTPNPINSPRLLTAVLSHLQPRLAAIRITSTLHPPTSNKSKFVNYNITENRISSDAIHNSNYNPLNTHGKVHGKVLRYFSPNPN